MRITNSMLAGNFLANLNRSLTRMSGYQDQLSSKRRIVRLSDDPIGTINTLAIRKKIDRLDQYQKNVSDASSWLTQSETALMDVNEVLKSAYEQALEASSDTVGKVDRDAIASYMEELRDHLFQTGNSTYGDKYIFGGYNTTTPPFTQSGTDVLYNGIDLTTAPAADIDAQNAQKIEFEIGTGKRVKVAMTGAEVMGTGNDNLIKIFDDLIAGLKAGDQDAIAASTSRISERQDHVLSLVADIGGQSNRLEFVSNRYELDRINYLTVQSDIEDIDTAEVIMQYKAAESVYTAALSAGSKIIQPSLIDFLN
ncbi:MAG: flagellar hook-associated protein FlgL [Clostridia bacterium]|nr:flagellar hook-associated protein FlgL [Clostridia bacterium]